MLIPDPIHLSVHRPARSQEPRCDYLGYFLGCRLSFLTPATRLLLYSHTHVRYCYALLVHNQLVRLGEDVSTTGVELALHALDDPVTPADPVDAFERADHQLGG